MATHRIVADTFAQTYRTASLKSQKSITLPKNELVTVIEENIGKKCNFNKIVTSSGIECFIEKKDIESLPTTPKSAPFVCINSIPNFSYVEPNWYKLSEDQPYYNERTFEYSICITINQNNLNRDREKILENAKRKGIIKLLQYYNKVSNQTKINEIFNYFIFANIKDIYIPYRPLEKVKILITIPRKYFDAIEEDIKNNFVFPNNVQDTRANFIVRLNSKQIKDLFLREIFLLKSYSTDIFVSNSQLAFKLNLDDPGFYDPSKQVREKLSLRKKADNINIFYRELEKFLSLNEFDITLDKNDRSEQIIELAINDECNIIYDIAVYRNNVCKRPRIGIREFLRTNPINDPTTVNFIKNIDRINKIEKCKVPWPEFIETYVYPDVLVREIKVDDVIQNFEKNKFEYAKDLYQIFFSLAEISRTTPVKTFEEALEEENKFLQIQTNQICELFNRKLYKGDDAFDRTNINNFLDKIDKISSNKEPSKEKRFAALNPITNQYSVLKETQKNKFIFSDVDKDTFQLNKLTIRDLSDPIKEVTLNSQIYNLTVYTAPSEYEIRFTTKNRDQFVLNTIYEKLNQVGLCKIIDFTKNCLTSLVRDFVEADFQARIIVGQIASLDYNQLTSEAIPYLPKQQQELVYEQLLTKITCLNTTTLLYILKRTLPREQFEELGLDEQTATYESVVQEVSRLMSTSVK